MPPRTNEFQKVILAVHRACAPLGARVVESAPLVEPDGGVREIDILIEHEICGYLVRVAVECRAHARAQDVGWIDDLIGKYRDLRVEKIVAVSKSGFTPEALKKAARLNIEALSPEEATEKDWQGVLGRLFLRFGGFSSQLRQIVLGFADLATVLPSSQTLTVDDIIEGPNGELPATVGGTGQQLYDARAQQAVGDLLLEQKLFDFANPGEGLVEGIEIKYAVPSKERFLRFPDGSRFEIGEILLRLDVRPLVVDPPHSHFKLAKTMVTVAHLSDQVGVSAKTIVLTQTRDADGRLQVGLQSVEVPPRRR